MARHVPPSLRRFARDVLPALHDAGDGRRSLERIRRIVSTDRWNSFDQFHKTTDTLRQLYEQAGANVEVTPIQTGGQLGSGRWVIHEAADVRSATLNVVSPSERRVADYHDNPWHLVQWSAATPPEGLRGELVVIDDADQLVQLRPGQLRGRFVLTKLDLRKYLKPLADTGALVAISDSPVPNLPDAVPWTKFGWGGIPLSSGPTRLVGFALSENQGRALRELHETQGPLALRANVDVHRYSGTHDVVSGLVVGRDDTQDEVWALAHSAEPGAVDNASGVATCVEIAHILETLIAQGVLPRPRRTIRLVNAYECYGFFAYLEQRRALQAPLAGVNLDAVGVKPELCEGEVQWHATVPMSAGFVDRVGEAILRSTMRIDDAGYRYRYKPFVSTSDTLIGDPRYGFPFPWLTASRGRRGKYDAYHSSADTVDLLSEDGLRLCAVATAGYLYYLADAGSDEMLELADAETRHFITQLAQASGHEAPYLRDQHRVSLQRLEHWMWDGDRTAILRQFETCRQRIDEQMPDAPPQPVRGPGSRRVPRRRAPLTPTLENTPPPLARRIREAGLYEWALFWADGHRHLAEITERLRVEYGREVTLDQVRRFFEAHAELGYVELIEPGDMVGKAQLARDLRALGLRRGMDVIVHSSLASIGHVKGGPQTVVDALLEVIGASGTLMMPSFNHRQAKVYNPRTTPTTNGAIPDAMWRRPGVVRSDHPTHAVAAIGPRAEQYCRDHTRRGIWSADSPIGQLIESGGYILSLGVTHAASTAVHVAEVAIPCGCIDQFGHEDRVVRADGAVDRVPGLAFRDGPCPVPLKELDQAIRRGRHQKRGKVGRAEATLVEARRVYQLRVRQLQDVCPTCSVGPRKPSAS